MPGVWAAGDISGSIAAGRNIGHWDEFYSYVYLSPYDYDVFAYGHVDAVITANNANNNPLGGRIGSIGAIDYIDGLIKAEHSIHHVHSGGEVTAAVLAPWIGSITANDAAMASLFPAPTPPESVAQDILDEAAAVHAEVLAAKAEVADDIAAVHADFAAAKKAEASALAQLEAEVAQSNAETLKSAHQALDDAKTDAQQDLAEARQEEEEYLDEQRKVAKKRKEGVEKKINELKAANQNAYDSRVKLASDLTEAFQASDEKMAARVKEEVAKADDERIKNKADCEEFEKKVTELSLKSDDPNKDPWYVRLLQWRLEYWEKKRGHH